MANWCRYCKGSYPKYWCEVTNEYIPWGIVERSCKNNGYKCSNYYVSTLTGEILKKDYNDPVLKNIRHLRDDYLEKDEKYSSMLSMYDSIGPVVVESIDSDTERYKTSTKIYSILDRISTLVEKEEIAKAVKYYSGMVNILVNKYGLDERYDEAQKTIGDESLIRPVKKVQKIVKTLD